VNREQTIALMAWTMIRIRLEIAEQTHNRDMAHYESLLNQEMMAAARVHALADVSPDKLAVSADAYFQSSSQ
jgi:hypothetical protein